MEILNKLIEWMATAGKEAYKLLKDGITGAILLVVLAVAVLAGCAGVLVDNLINVSLHFAVPAFIFWWLAGAAVGRGARHARPDAAGRADRVPGRPGAVRPGVTPCRSTQTRIFSHPAHRFSPRTL